MTAGIFLGAVGTLILLALIAGVLDVIERVRTWRAARRGARPRRQSWAPRLELIDLQVLELVSGDRGTVHPGGPGSSLVLKGGKPDG